jgi:hypothetical protein
MRTTEHRSSPVTVYVHRSRMRGYVHVVGGVLVGLGLAAAVGLGPGLLLAADTAGTGLTLLCLTLLCLGLLLPEAPDAAAESHGRSCPPHR